MKLKFSPRIFPCESEGTRVPNAPKKPKKHDPDKALLLENGC